MSEGDGSSEGGHIHSGRLAKHIFETFVEMPQKKIEQLEGEVKNLQIDPLTGLEGEYPLRDMINGLQNRWEADRGKGDSLKGTFVIVDLTALHDTNDTYGKLAGGDDYLKAVGEGLKRVARGKGRVFRAREGADEFILYLPGFKFRNEIEETLDTLDSDLAKQQESSQDKYPGIKFGLSYSVATFHKDYGPKDAYADANNRMNEAKQSKKGEGRVGDVGRLFANELTQEDKRNE
jgi:diguanylate cyclase (GGDEF)-like protein